MPKSRQDNFIDAYTDFALDVAAVTGLAPEVVMGQAALETGWGRAVAGNNMFGVKGRGQSVVTHEHIPGRGLVKTTESFRAYANPEESFQDYGALTLRGRNWGDIITPGMTVAQQIASIGKSGYATDPRYTSKLSGVVDRIQENRTFQDKVVGTVSSLAPASVDVFSDVGIPTGAVEFAGALPDLSQNFAGVPASPNFSDVFSTGGRQPSDYSIPDSLYSGVMDGSTFAPTDVEALFSGSPLGPAQGFTSPDAATLFSGGALGGPQAFDAAWSGDLGGFNAPGMIDQASFNERFSGGLPSAPISTDYPSAELGISPVGPQGMGETFGVKADPWGPGTGVSAGVNEGPWGQTPDFGAPSLDARNAIDRFEGQMEVRTNPDLDMTNEAISSRVMAELSPQAPALAAQPFSAPPSTPPAPSAPPTQSPAPSSVPGTTGFSIGDVAPPSTRSSLPSVGPAVDIPAAPSIAETNYSDLVGSTYGVGKPMGGFMDAMANPSLAAGYGLAPQPQSPIGWGSKGLTIGGFASPVDAIASLFGGGQGGGYQGSGMAGDTYSNSRGFVDPGGWSLGNLDKGLVDSMMDGSAYGQTGGWFGGFGGFLDRTFGTGWDGREGGTADTGFSGGTRGDGSYSSQSGYNDNNPQGIL